MITKTNDKRNEAKAMTKHVSCDRKCNSIVQHVVQIKNEVIKHVNVNVKIRISVNRIIVGILAHVFVRIVSI